MTIATAHTNKDRTLVGWSEALRRVGRRKLADALETDSVADFTLVKQLGLPTYQAYLLPCAEFMRRFRWFKTHFVCRSYYINLLPVRDGFRKLSLVGFRDLSDARRFIRLHLTGSYQNYLLRVSEFEENVYGGSIMSDEDIVLAELSPGLQRNVAYGSVPVISVTFTSYSGCAKHTGERPEERLLLWRAIQAISVRDTHGVILPLGRSMVHECGPFWFLKGYFEFAYTKIDQAAPLRLVFFDAKLNPAHRSLVSTPQRTT